MKTFVSLSIVFLSLTTVSFTSPARADKASYCQAYARDFSDQRATDKATWQHKYQIALDACLASNKPQAAAKPAPVPVQPAVVKVAAPKIVPPQPQVAPPQEPLVAKPVAQPGPVIADSAKLLPGTPAWNDYCAKKYTSFNAKTGMYLSHTGAQRHCLVTKDFAG
jgi:BA14K-like protein